MNEQRPEQTPPVATDAEKKEAVKQTIDEIRSENGHVDTKKNGVRDVLFKIVCVVFFPITLCVFGFRMLFKKLKIGITAKTTVVFTAVFGLMIIGYAAFILASISNLVGSGQAISQAYMQRMTITSAVLVLVFIVLGAVLGGFSSQYMIEPVRKITHLSLIHI